ncbi:MAG: amidohydrolase family protein [Bacillota bacterium]|nr:amidohydrolase family protein [Bacillota bacterium]
MKIDVYNHFLPKKYFDRMIELVPKHGMVKRVSEIPCMVDLDLHFRHMDLFGDDYRQILTIAAPPIELFGANANDMARLGNDCMADLIAKYPDRFPGFIAGVAMNDPEGCVAEAKRAINDLGAVGIQIYTNVLGKPLDAPEFEPLFDLMAELDLPIFLHPDRTASFSDYQSETKGKYEIWWTFGWPYETSAACARLVFSGLFDKHPNIKIVTHHLGGMIPYFAGRIGPGWDQLGARTCDEDLTLVLKRLKKRPVDYFHMFYGDTALSGAKGATECGLDFFGVEKVLFASDAPFDPEKGTAFIRWTIEVIDSLNISEADRYAIYEGNARKLLKLKV